MFAADLPFSFAWVDDSTSSTSTPDAVYAHNTTGESIEVTRGEVGQYRVKFSGVYADQFNRGTVQVTPYGSNYASCGIGGWQEGSSSDDASILINCFDEYGDRTNSQFNVAMILPDNGAEIAYAWGPKGYGPTATSVSERYAFNPSGGVIETTRTGPGQYSVRFEGLGNERGGNVQVSPYGNGTAQATVQGWSSSGGDLWVTVHMTSRRGDLVDSQFTIAVIPPDAQPETVGHAWAVDSINSEEIGDNTWAHNPSGGGIFKERIGPGQYRVTFEDYNPTSDSGGHVMVSPYGSTSRRAQVEGWTSIEDDFTVYVQTYDAGGQLADGQFSIAVTPDQPEYVPPTPPPLAEQAPISYAWVNTLSGPASPVFSHNRAGGTITVENLAVGRFAVEFEGINAGQRDLGNVQVTTYGLSNAKNCSIDHWASGRREDDVRIVVACYDLETAQPSNANFNVSIVQPDNLADIAYAWITAGSETSVTYTNSDGYVENPTGNVSVERVIEGAYNVRFEGQGIGVEGGHVQATAYGRGHNAAVTAWWHEDGDLVAQVELRAMNGFRSDGSFTIAVIPTSSDQESISYAWISGVNDDPNVHLSEYASNAEGGTIRRTRSDVGRYRVTFEDINYTEEMGGHVMVTPYADARKSCSVAAWRSVNANLTANVECFDIRTGEPSDALFNIAVIPTPGPRPGDMNSDGVIDVDDVDALCAVMGSYRLHGDLNDDGHVDGADMDRLIHDILGTHYGDANLDGVFNSTDLIQLFAAGKYETGAAASWSEGDFNCDGVVNTSDLIKALADGGYEG